MSLYKEKHPSLLFIDYHMMPDMNGDEATRQIRRHEVENDLHRAFIIIYTADLTDEATSLLKAAGADEIMSKPPPKGFIASIVKRLVMVDEKPRAIESESRETDQPREGNSEER